MKINTLDVLDKKDPDYWHNEWLRIAKEFSTNSKDPSKKIGAVCVDADNNPISMAYNGFARDILDLPERYNVREEKYKYVIHAEQNLIYNCARKGVSMKDCTVYVYGLPVCNHCASALIQCGVSRVIAKSPLEERWEDARKLAVRIFGEANVCYTHYVEV